MEKLIALCFGVILFASCTKTEQTQLNVLMIAVDDLRPELGCYDSTLVQSPNIDRLASQGVTFSNSFCNIPVCGASRASLMTGMRPTHNRFIVYSARADVQAPSAILLVLPAPRMMRRQG